MPDARADEHEGAVAVGETADHARAPPNLPVGPFDHVVRADAPAAPRGIPGQQVGRRLPDALPEAVGRRLEPPAFHLRGDRLGLGEGGFQGYGR